MFREGPTSAGSSKKQESSRKTSISAFDYAKAFDCVDHNKLKMENLWKKSGKFWKRWEYKTTWPASWETYMQVRKQQLELEMEDWFQIGKGVHQGYILSACLFNLYSENIMRNTGLDEAQAGIKIAGGNINNLRYAMTPPLWQKVKKN